jgi:hypothetical protein
MEGRPNIERLPAWRMNGLNEAPEFVAAIQ